MRGRRHIFSVMFCSSCGAKCSSSAKFYGQCGHQINEAVEKTSKKAANSVDVQELITVFPSGISLERHCWLVGKNRWCRNTRKNAQKEAKRVRVKKKRL